MTDILIEKLEAWELTTSRTRLNSIPFQDRITYLEYTMDEWAEEVIDVIAEIATKRGGRDG